MILMFSATELKAQMVRKGFTQEKLANAIGITTKTLNLKIKSGKFQRSEIQDIINVLEISDPNPIFFARR